MVGVYNNKHNYAMLYVPKAACCVVRKTYVDTHLCEFNQDQISLFEGKLFHRLSSLHNLNNVTTQQLNDIKKYIVVRDPYTRALSAYYDKFLYLRNNASWKTLKFVNLFHLFNLTNDIELLKVLTENDIHEKELPFDVFLKEMAPSYIKKAYIKNDSFLEYLKFIQLCNTHNIKSFDEHHNSQNTRTNVSLQGVDVNKNTLIVHLENFQEEIFKAYEYVLPSELYEKATTAFLQNCGDKNTRNSTASKTYTSNLKSYNFTKNEIVKILNVSKALPCFQSMICSQTEQLIYDIYRDDFETFTYKRIVL
jgi:hypothetical protein